MAYHLVEEHTIGTSTVGPIERIYRCDNNYGAVVYQQPPGEETGEGLLLEPVLFFRKSAEAYEVLSKEKATRGVDSGDLKRPKILESYEEVERVLDQLDALPPAQ